MSGGEALTQSLVREGVEVVSGIPGIHMSGSVVAMRDEPAIRHITTRHENGAAHMAYGYARASEKPGVALVVPRAGVFNAASGLATAYARSTPVFLIAGQILRGQMGKDLGAIHKVFNHAEIVAPVTKWRRQAMRPSDVPAAVSEAFRQMRTGRPRPVYLEMPPEVAVEREEVQLRDPAPVSRIVPSPDDLRRAADVIAKSRLPLIYAGGGIMLSGAEDVLREFAEATNIPVVTSSGGKGALPDNHPLTYASELSTAVKYSINTVTVVFRDDSYGNVARDLEDFFGGSYETDLHNPDLVKFAESFGAVGLRAEDPLDLATLLPEALKRKAPVIIDVPVRNLELPRAKFLPHLPKVPWTQPQEGLIAS